MSRQSTSLLALAVAATADVEAERFVTGAGAHAVAGGNTLGVSRFKAASGGYFTADVVGTAVVTAGGAIPAGAPIEVGANGKAIVLDEGVQVARAAPGASAAADGDPIEVLLIVN